MTQNTLFPEMKLTPPQMSVIHTVAIYRKVFSERMDANWTKDYKRSIAALVKRNVLKMELMEDDTFTLEFATGTVKQAVDEFYFQVNGIRRGHLLPANTPEVWENGIGVWVHDPKPVEAVETDLSWLDDPDGDEHEMFTKSEPEPIEPDAQTDDEKWRMAERKAERDMWCIDRYQQRYDNGAFCRMSAQIYAQMDDEHAHQTIICILDTAMYLCGMNYRHYVEQSREWMKWSLDVKTSNEAFIMARKFLGAFAQDDLIPF